MSPSKELRDASNAAEVMVRDFGVESSMRLDVFRAKQAAEKNIKESGQKLSPEEQRLMDKMILDGKRAGLALPEKEREELTQLKKELSQTCLEFSVSVMVTFHLGFTHICHRKTSMKRMWVHWNTAVFPVSLRF